MPEAASTRLGLIGPTGSTDDIALGDDIINAIIARLEAAGAGFLQGTSRPSASGALQGFFYIHTGTGLVSYCTGSVWLDVSLPSTTFGRSLLNAADATKVPGGEIGYDEITASKTVSATTEGTATSVVSCAAHTFDGAPVVVEFFAPYVSVALSSGATGSNLTLILCEGATVLGTLAELTTLAFGANAVAAASPLVGRYRFTPSAGSHSYTIKAYEQNGNAVIYGGTGGSLAYLPAFARFTKV